MSKIMTVRMTPDIWGAVMRVVGVSHPSIFAINDWACPSKKKSPRGSGPGIVQSSAVPHTTLTARSPIQYQLCAQQRFRGVIGEKVRISSSLIGKGGKLDSRRRRRRRYHTDYDTKASTEYRINLRRWWHD